MLGPSSLRRKERRIAYDTPSGETREMMFEAAYLTEDGTTFAVVTVEDSVITNRAGAGKVIKQFEPFFRCPILLIVAYSHRTFGPDELALRVKRTGYAGLPWRKWSIAA